MRTADRLRQKLPGTSTLADPVLHTSTWAPLYPATASPCALREAIDEECEIDIGYTDENGRTSTRRLRPVAVISPARGVTLRTTQLSLTTVMYAWT